MRSGQYAGLNGDRSDVVKGSAIRPSAHIQHLIAENALHQGVIQISPFFALVLSQLFDERSLDGGNLGVTFQLGVFLRVRKRRFGLPDRSYSRSRSKPAAVMARSDRETYTHCRRALTFGRGEGFR